MFLNEEQKHFQIIMRATVRVSVRVRVIAPYVCVCALCMFAVITL